MDFVVQIPEPLMFNPLKHFLPFIREYVNIKIEEENYPGSKTFIRELRHIGTRVMDIYSGELSVGEIFNESISFLEFNEITGRKAYMKWAGTGNNNFRIVRLSDDSQWAFKYYEHEKRYVHFFPARSSSHSIRVKANTLKSAILYQVLAGKDYVSEHELNKTRALAGLSPIRDIADVAAITEIIEILRL